MIIMQIPYNCTLCNFVECLEPPNGGQLMYSNFLFADSEAEYKCNNDMRTRKCNKETGVWEDEALICGKINDSIINNNCV